MLYQSHLTLVYDVLEAVPTLLESVVSDILTLLGTPIGLPGPVDTGVSIDEPIVTEVPEPEIISIDAPMVTEVPEPEIISLPINTTILNSLRLLSQSFRNQKRYPCPLTPLF